ncbi:hypothetical protein F5Y17DRAFT_11430 [Xylariaceae sp. FL0594]|nr:hypothetical protein F5Y17DRAFT_11430 [Xylariaceae sp. FL0594]
MVSSSADMHVSGVDAAAGVRFPSCPVVIAAREHARTHARSEEAYNHCVRSAYWALVLARKLDFSPLLLHLANDGGGGENETNHDGVSSSQTTSGERGARVERPDIDVEVVVLACLLHDLGSWTSSPSATGSDSISVEYGEPSPRHRQNGEAESDRERGREQEKEKRFEVKGADLARDFIEKYIRDGRPGGEEWDLERVKKVWYAIAFHTSRFIAPFGRSLEVATAHLGIMADCAGPMFPANPWAATPEYLSATESQLNNPVGGGVGQVITVDEFKEVARAFPYVTSGVGFGLGVDPQAAMRLQPDVGRDHAETHSHTHAIPCCLRHESQNGKDRDGSNGSIIDLTSNSGTGQSQLGPDEAHRTRRQTYENSWLATVDLTVSVKCLEDFLD